MSDTKSSFLTAAFSAKYRSLTALILLFLLIILLVLAVNLAVLSTLKTQQRWTELVTRQVISTESITARLLELDERPATSSEARAAHADLVRNVAEFSDVLNALRVGGKVSSRIEEGGVEDIRPIPYERSNQLLSDVSKIWEEMKSTLRPLTTGSDNLTSSNINSAVSAAMRLDPEMGTLLREVRALLQERTNGLSNILAAVNYAAIAFAPLYCFTLIFFFISKLREGDVEIEKRAQDLNALSHELQESKQETDSILNFVGEGLFLLDEELTIGNQHSRASREIFGIEDLAGKNFLRLFKRLVPSKTYDTAQKYLNLVFKPHIEEATLGKFNPFKELEVHFDDAHGGLQTKYLDFQFKRIFEEKVVRQVMVTVSDVTERVKLEQQLRESEEATQRQMEMMLDILHCDLAALNEFLDSAEENLRSISAELKGDSDQSLELEVDKQEEYRNLLNRIFRIMHTIKGNAAMIKLNVFEARAHEFEEKIMEVKNKRDLKGNDFLPITVALSEMLSYIQEVRQLMERMGEVQTQLAENFAADTAGQPQSEPEPGKQPEPGSTAAPATGQNEHSSITPEPAAEEQEPGDAARPKPVININISTDDPPPKPAAPAGNSLVGMVGQLASTLAEKYDKKVELEAADFEENGLPQRYKFALRDIIVQLVRNSVCHGIESPEERVIDDKPETGKIHLGMSHSDNGRLIITISDDGRGLPAEKLRKKAVEMGKANADDIMTWDNNDLYGLIFDSGFSTADEVTSDAGRGVGMDVVRETVAELGGSINVSSKAGKGCEFQLVLPEATE